MKARLSILLILTLMLGLLLPQGCAPAAEQKTIRLGNSNANIVNMGMSVVDGEWLYFLNAAKDGALYKMKTDGTADSQITDDQAGFLNYTDGWIYYSNGKDASKIYRIRPDGTERKLISEFASTYLMTDGEWLYSIDNTPSADPANTHRIHRSKLDGTGRVMLSQQGATQYNLAGDSIYYIAEADSRLHRMQTDGTEDTVVGEIKAKTIIVSGDKVYFMENKEEAGQIWSVGLDGTGAVQLSEDQATAFNVSGDWIYYGHPKEEMMSFEFKKMKLDGTEATLVNTDAPMVITVHDDLLGYLQMDFATFSMGQVFVKTDGSGRREFKLTPETTDPETTQPTEEPTGETKEYFKNEVVVGEEMILTVDRVYVTNLTGDQDAVERFLNSEPVFYRGLDDTKAFITFTVKNPGEHLIDVHERITIGFKSDQSETGYRVFLADVTDRMELILDREFLPSSEYLPADDRMPLQPGETKILQASVRHEGYKFPLVFSLMDSASGRDPYASILLGPDRTDQALRPDEAMREIREHFAESKMVLEALEPDVSITDEKVELWYLFNGREEETQLYMLNAFTHEIFTGEMKDGKAVPIEAVKGASAEVPSEEGPGEKVRHTFSSQGMTVTPDYVYATNLVVTEKDPIEGFLKEKSSDITVFITFILVNDGDEPKEVYKKVGSFNRESPEDEILWFSLADVTDRKEDLNDIGYLTGSGTEDSYGTTLMVQPGETRLIQARGILNGRNSTVDFTLFDDQQHTRMGTELKPDRIELALKPEAALTTLMKELQPDSETEITALEPRYSRANQETSLLYPFELKGEDGTVTYFIVDGISQEVMEGQLSEGQIVPTR